MKNDSVRILNIFHDLIWPFSMFLCFQIFFFLKYPFPIIYWSWLPISVLFLVFPWHASFSPRRVNILRGLNYIGARKKNQVWENLQHLKWFLDELMCLCEEKENPACIRGVLNNVKPFSNLCLPAFSCTQISLWRGRVRPLHCNCLRLMGAISHWWDIQQSWTFVRCFFFFF